MNQNEPNPMSGTGYLIVRVSTALGAIPLMNATVTVRNDIVVGDEGERGGIIRVVTTDRDGNTPRIPLPAPPRSNSTSPGSMLPYATYNVDVEAEGYYRQFFNNVPVYDTITSIQPAMLIPFAQSGSLDSIAESDSYFNENVNPSLRPHSIQS